jgi:hypothetical protein
VKPVTPALVVRGISDLADEKKAALEAGSKDSWRRYAARNAMRFVLMIMRRRPQLDPAYALVERPLIRLEPHRESARMCLEARVKARKVGMRALAFSPFLVCEDGLPETRLTLEATTAEGTLVGFADIALRSMRDQKRIALEGDKSLASSLKRTDAPGPLELLVAMAEGASRITVSTVDEFGRTARVTWPKGA